MNTSKVLRTVAFAAVAAMLAPSVFAQAVANNLDVQVNLTSQCRFSGGTAPSPNPIVDFGAYTAFQAGANTATPVTLAFECTRGFGATPTLTWDGGTAGGVIAGLNYTLTASAQSRTGGTAATAASIGTADAVSYSIGGSMPGAQAGAGAGGATTALRTLTITF